MPVPSSHCGRFQACGSRRAFLEQAGGGFGALALQSLLAGSASSAAAASADNPLAPRIAHFPAKAEAVIWLFMEGAPSSADTFDYKPELNKRDGQTIDIDVFNGNPGPLM
jgi:hypothetical protein